MRRLAIIWVAVILIAWSGAAVAAFGMVEWRGGDTEVVAESGEDSYYPDDDICNYYAEGCETPAPTPGDFRP